MQRTHTSRSHILFSYFLLVFLQTVFFYSLFLWARSCVCVLCCRIHFNAIRCLNCVINLKLRECEFCVEKVYVRFDFGKPSKKCRWRNGRTQAEKFKWILFFICQIAGYMWDVVCTNSNSLHIIQTVIYPNIHIYISIKCQPETAIICFSIFVTLNISFATWHEHCCTYTNTAFKITLFSKQHRIIPMKHSCKMEQIMLFCSPVSSLLFVSFSARYGINNFSSWKFDKLVCAKSDDGMSYNDGFIWIKFPFYGFSQLRIHL